MIQKNPVLNVAISLKPVFTTCAVRMILLSVVFVCHFVYMFVCLSVCQHDNAWTITVRDIITKFSGRHPMVKLRRQAKFENVHGVCGR